MNQLTTINEDYFKIFYSISDNTLNIVEDGEINNLNNAHSTAKFDFIKIGFDDIITHCNLNTYNKFINEHYLSNESEYLFHEGNLKTFHRNKKDKLLILEGIGDYLKIFNTILVYDNIISPVHQRLIEFLEIHLMTIFTEYALLLFQDVVQDLELDINHHDIVYSLSSQTPIFSDMAFFIRNTIKEDLSLFSFKSDSNFSEFVSTKNEITENDFITDEATLQSQPASYNFLQELYPETTNEIKKIMDLDIFDNAEYAIQIPFAKSIKNMRFTPHKNIAMYPDFFINNILINFYRNVNLKSVRVVAVIYEKDFKISSSNNDYDLLIVYGFEVNFERELTPLNKDILSMGVAPSNPKSKLIFKKI